MNKTLLTKEEWGKAVRVTYINDERSYRYALAQLEAQDNKSFKAGYHQRELDPLDKEDRCDKCYKQGIREVVEWIRTHSDYPHLYNRVNPAGKTPLDRWEPCQEGRLMDEFEWQSRLKEWGID